MVCHIKEKMQHLQSADGFLSLEVFLFQYREIVNGSSKYVLCITLAASQFLPYERGDLGAEQFNRAHDITVRN